MKKKTIFSASMIFCFSLGIYADCSQQPSNAESQKPSHFEDKEGDIKWHGPGVYYGQWFETESAYDQWLQEEHRSGRFQDGDGSHEGVNGLHGDKDYVEYGTDYGPP